MLRTLRRTFATAFVAVFVAAACGGTTTPPAATTAATQAPATAKPTQALGTADRPLIMAFVPSQDTARITASGKAITASLEAATGLKWDVKVPTSYAATVEGMCAGQIDVAWLNTLSYVLASQKNCADIMLATLRKDEKGVLSTTYNSQIVVRADSGINTIADLKGKKFAFVDPISTSGTLFPTLKIKQETGQDPRTFFSQTIFAGGHDKAIIALMTGQVDAAASFIDARTLVQTQFPDVMTKTKVIATAGPIPNDTVSARKGLPVIFKWNLGQALLTYAGTDAGKAALKSLYSIDGLARADPKVYEPIAEAAKAVGLDLEKESQATARPVATPAPSPSKTP